MFILSFSSLFRIERKSLYSGMSVTHGILIEAYIYLNTTSVACFSKIYDGMSKRFTSLASITDDVMLGRGVARHTYMWKH